MIPTMVSLPERTALRDIVALNWMGFGEIVEIGSFAGGSAIAMLEGMEASRHEGKLHCYDTFSFPEGGHEDLYRSMLPVKGRSFRHIFDAATREWGHRLKVVEGDASAAKWDGGSIEMMHIDCSISREFHEKIASIFYPSLIASALVVHQDFGYEKAPFIAEIMERLKPWFGRIGRVGTSVYFTLAKTITRADIEAALCGEAEKAA